MRKNQIRRVYALAVTLAIVLGVMQTTTASAKTKISKCTIKLAKTSYTYTGKAIKPKVTVKYKKKTLKKGKHYTVKYSDNVNPGTGFVKIKGKGAYTGTVKKEFRIDHAPVGPEKPGDGFVHNLSFVQESKIPPLTVVGDRWPCDESVLQEAWKKYYSLMVQILGPVSDDFFTQGLTWKMTDETLSHRVNEQRPETNTVEMGIKVASEDTAQCIAGLIHETGHMWLQDEYDAIRFDHGQWIWEAVTGIVERVLVAEGIDQGAINAAVDLYDYEAWENLNGVVNDGDKACRVYSDIAAAGNVYLLDTFFSSPGTYDYWVKVNNLRNEYSKKSEKSFTSKEEMKDILDEAAGWKEIDGMKPSDWLFSRSVSNISGNDGTYLNVYGNYGDALGRDVRVNVYGFVRKNTGETPLTGQSVTVSAYNASGKKLASADFILGNEGTVSKENLKRKDGKDLSADDFGYNSAIRYVAEATVNGWKYTNTNYGIVTDREEMITHSDDRLFFILTDKEGNLVNSLKPKDIEVTGATSVDTSALGDALLIVHAKQGETVSVSAPACFKRCSKPAGARIMPILATD